MTIRSRVADSPRPRRELRDSTGDTAMLGAVRIERLGDLRAGGFDALQAESEQAGPRCLRRLASYATAPRVGRVRHCTSCRRTGAWGSAGNW